MFSVHKITLSRLKHCVHMCYKFLICRAPARFAWIADCFLETRLSQTSVELQIKAMCCMSSIQQAADHKRTLINTPVNEMCRNNAESYITDYPFSLSSPFVCLLRGADRTDIV